MCNFNDAILRWCLSCHAASHVINEYDRDKGCISILTFNCLELTTNWSRHSKTRKCNNSTSLKEMTVCNFEVQ